MAEGKDSSAQGSDVDRLRSEYLSLLSGNLLDLKFAQFGPTDEYRRVGDAITVAEYERLDSILTAGTLPLSDAARARVVTESVLNQLRSGAERSGSNFGLAERAEIDRWEARYGSQVAAGRYHGMLEVMRAVSEEVERNLASMHLSVAVPVLVCEYPTGDFNAWCCPSASGMLILLNRGLFMLIYQMAKLYGMSLSLNHPGPGDVSVRMRDGRIVVAEEAPYSTEFIVNSALDVLMSYVRFRQPTKAGRLPPLGGVCGHIGIGLAMQSEKFVVAHEYGHLVAGHLTGKQAMPQPTVGPDVGRIPVNHAQELQADGIATAVMVTPAKGAHGRHETVHPQSAAGIAFFFALSNLVRRLEGALGHAAPTTPDDHPSADQRWSLLRRGFQDLGGPSATALADGCVAWMAAIERGVFEKLIQMSREPSTG